MNERERIHRIVNDLALTDGRYVLAGSAVMVLHGIDRAPRDIDIFVATATWFNIYNTTEASQFTGLGSSPANLLTRVWSLFVTDPDDRMRRSDPPYLYRVMHGIEVNIFHSWRKRGIADIDVAFWLHNAEIVDGIRCIPLNCLLHWKEVLGRAKDQVDIEVLKLHLQAA